MHPEAEQVLDPVVGVAPPRGAGPICAIQGQTAAGGASMSTARSPRRRPPRTARHRAAARPPPDRWLPRSGSACAGSAGRRRHRGRAPREREAPCRQSAWSARPRPKPPEQSYEASVLPTRRGRDARGTCTVWHRERVILREPATALDPRVRTLWLVENLLATGLAAALVVGGTITAAMLGAATVAWLVGVLSEAGGRRARRALVRLRPPRPPPLPLRGHRPGALRGPRVALAALPGRPARACRRSATSGPLMRALGLVAVLVRTASSAGGPPFPA